MSNTDGICEYVLDPDDPDTWGEKEREDYYVDDELSNEGKVDFPVEKH